MPSGHSCSSHSSFSHSSHHHYYGSSSRYSDEDTAAEVVIMLIALVVILILVAVFHKDKVNPDGIYVEAIGRHCDVVDDNYYDETTDCYFWFNTNVSPAQWQYWYEGISSDYGNYGWMEFDDKEGVWYIEEATLFGSHWVQLDMDKYGSESDRLWHFANAYENYAAAQN